MGFDPDECDVIRSSNEARTYARNGKVLRCVRSKDP